MYKYLYAITSILFLVSSGCVNEIPLNIESSEQIVVSSLFHSSDKQILTLVYSRNLGGGIYYEPVEDGAIALLYKNDTLIGNFVKSGSRTWEIDHKPISGASYKIEIEITGKKTISATTRMPYDPQVILDHETLHKKTFEQKEQLSPQWIFALNAKADESWENPLDTPKIKQADQLIENIGTNHPAADRFNQNGNLTDVLQDASLPAYDFYIRLNPEIENTVFDIEAAFYPTCFVVFRNVSYEYDQYLKSSLQKMFIYIDEDDPVQWFDENQVYTNINNGVGIFAAYTDQVIVIGKPEIPIK